MINIIVRTILMNYDIIVSWILEAKLTPPAAGLFAAHGLWQILLVGQDQTCRLGADKKMAQCWSEGGSEP